jgi:hypothetical protein
MKLNLIVKDFYKIPGEPNRIVYVGEDGLLFDGPEHNVILGCAYTVETSIPHPEDKLYYIVKFIGEGKRLQPH